MKFKTSPLIQKKGEVFFCSDFHFLPTDSTSGFQAILDRLAHHDSLIILGDLFEIWYENWWSCAPGYRRFLEILSKATSEGKNIHLVVGNRDFMAGRIFHKKTGVLVHKNSLTIQKGENKLLALHGDELATQDISYQSFRKKIRHPITLCLLRSLPLFVLKKLSGDVRQKSIHKVKQMDPNMKIDLEVIRPTCEKKSIQTSVAGHFHREESLVGEHFPQRFYILAQSTIRSPKVLAWNGEKITHLEIDPL